jgi:hypothetical protein
VDSIVIALKRQRSLLEDVLDLAIGGLDMLDAGRLDDTERLLLLRAECMKEFVMTEANVSAKMSAIQKDLTVKPDALAELHDLNLEIIRLAKYIVTVDERAEELGQLLAARIAARA